MSVGTTVAHEVPVLIIAKKYFKKHLMGHLLPLECLSLVVHKAVTHRGAWAIGSHLTILPSLGNYFVPAHARAKPISHSPSCAGSDDTLYSAVSSSPFPLLKIKEALYKVRGDLYAGAMKLHEDTLSIKGELELLVDEKDGEEIWNLTEGDSVEVGAFRVRSHLYHFSSFSHFAAVCTCGLYLHTVLRSEAVPDENDALLCLLQTLLFFNASLLT